VHLFDVIVAFIDVSFALEFTIIFAVKFIAFAINFVTLTIELGTIVLEFIMLLELL